MREIKFRAWDKENKRMVSELVSYALPNATITFDGLVYHRNEFNIQSQYELMQYTGLKDKNGKEIYESDYLGDGDEIYYQVVWDERDFVLGWRLKSVNGDGLNYTFEEVMDPEKRTVIGNIYQNPELNN